jgi:hypothetical protein
MQKQKSLLINPPKRKFYVGLLNNVAEAKVVEEYYLRSYIGYASRQLGKTVYVKEECDKLRDRVKRLFK